jgi:single-strand selective monofunctional uracil DNA glycosylase
MSLVPISKKLAKSVDGLSFDEPVAYTYNPLNYAWNSHREYLDRFGTGPKKYILIGMNPGPFGMAQTGVPFGDVRMVKDWMGIEKPVKSPPKEHPKRPVQGFSCPRKEVSGTRLWTWASENFENASSFFENFFVWNYCPLSFMEEGGKNITPDKLNKDSRDALFEICDEALEGVVSTLNPSHLIGIGVFAAKRCKPLAQKYDLANGPVLHPSPASPAANKDWAGGFEKGLKALGVTL